MVVFVDLPALHRLGILRHRVASELTHRPQRLGQRADAQIGVLLLALLQGLNKLLHLVLRFLVLDGQQHPRLDVHQVRRHRDELARHLKVKLLTLLEVGKVLL